MPTPDIARALLENRFRPAYGAAGFHPPYPTWPVSEAAIAGAPDITPRILLQKVDAHIRRCLDRGTADELTDLGGSGDAVRAVPAEPVAGPGLAALDARFVEGGTSIHYLEHKLAGRNEVSKN